MKISCPARRKAIKAFKYLHTQPEKSKQAGAQSPPRMQINAKQLRALKPFVFFFSRVFGRVCLPGF